MPWWWYPQILVCNMHATPCSMHMNNERLGILRSRHTSVSFVCDSSVKVCGNPNDKLRGPAYGPMSLAVACNYPRGYTVCCPKSSVGRCRVTTLKHAGW